MTTPTIARVVHDPAPLAVLDPAPLVAAGHAAARAVFRDYRDRKGAQTLRAQGNDLARFAEYLAACGVTTPPDWLEPAAWRGISWGLVAGFVRYLIVEGLAVASINRSLSTVKTYARLAMQAGAIGIERLSPHDARHYWATQAIRNGTNIKSLQDAGGWSSPAMPLRYAESAAIANDGVRLG